VGAFSNVQVNRYDVRYVRPNFRNEHVPVIVVGVDHRSTPAEVVERLVAGSDDLYEVAASLLHAGTADEVIPLGTCLRSELYVATEHPAEVVDAIEKAFFPNAVSTGNLAFAIDGDAVLQHLFRVASGLQSTVLGETEILGQVARAWETAHAKGTSGPILDSLFRHAIASGKRARSETLISHGVTSIAHAAVAMAKEQVVDLRGKRILVIGAGDMSERMALAAERATGVTGILVANRTWERANALAERVNGRAIDFEDIAKTLSDVDVVFTSTGSPLPIITKAMADGVGSLLIVDFAVPRDTEAGVENLDDVDVLLMEDLQAFAQVGVQARASETVAVEAIVAEEIQRYLDYERERTVAPVISRLRDHAEAVRQSEIDRYSKKLQDLNPSQRSAVEAMTKGIINKLLHEPTIRLKETAGQQEGDLIAAALSQLFES
jgi:glutamyl-tRNA reductase